MATAVVVMQKSRLSGPKKKKKGKRPSGHINGQKAALQGWWM